MDDIREFCKNKGADLLCIREISREDSRLKSLHCVFKFDNDQVESRFHDFNQIRKRGNGWPPLVHDYQI